MSVVAVPRHLIGRAGRWTRLHLNRRRSAGLTLIILALLVLLTGLVPSWPRYARLALIAPSTAYRLLGFDRPRNYLIVGQNTDEPRPTGGFLGSMALVTLSGGSLDSFVARDSTEFVDQNAVVQPPEPFARYMGFGSWYVRDANWSADFPTAARQIEWFWRRDHLEDVDAVIAFDQQFLISLLEAVGPVRVPEFNETITAENFRERALDWVYPTDATSGQTNFQPGAKSNFVSTASKAILQQVRRPSPSTIPALAGALARAIREKHVLVYFTDPALADLPAQVGADGGLIGAPGDYLYPVDTTMSYTKNAPYVREEFGYDVLIRPEDGLLTSVFATTYENRYEPTLARAVYPRWYLGAFWNWQSQKMDDREGFWASFLRAYVPNGAILLDARGTDELPRYAVEAGRVTLGSFVPIDAGERKRVEYEYATPGGLLVDGDSREYRLTVQQQPGRPARPLRVTAHLPDGWTFASTDGQLGEDGRTVTWAATLDRDLTFSAGVVPTGR